MIDVVAEVAGRHADLAPLAVGEPIQLAVGQAEPIGQRRGRRQGWDLPGLGCALRRGHPRPAAGDSPRFAVVDVRGGIRFGHITSRESHAWGAMLSRPIGDVRDGPPLVGRESMPVRGRHAFAALQVSADASCH